jgi:hypothetical protein
VRLLSCGALSVWLVLANVSGLRGQDKAPAVPPQDQFFTGTVTALSDTSVTVTRTTLGSESTVRTFAITPDTHVEGKLKMKARVTVRFVSEPEGDRVVRIIVRGSAPAPPPPKKQ